MITAIKKLFSKSQNLPLPSLPQNEVASFRLEIPKEVVGNVVHIGTLRCKNGQWEFAYADQFKQLSDVYNYIVGFGDLDKTYTSTALWPYFQIRIPGLSQPAIKEILEEENIDANNEVALLERFGKRSISNPYHLIPA